MNAVALQEGDCVPPRKLKVFGFSMVRNEADIIPAFIRQAVELFDNFVFVDVLSTDGTAAFLDDAATRNENISIYRCRTKEKYQAAMMNALARDAVRAEADWVFFLDADEFLLVESRAQLETCLTEFGGEVMSMPWINLVPSVYGDFTSFDMEQKFFWSGRTSTFCKVAVSALYLHSCPDAYIDEGNHTIRPYKDGPVAPEHFGIPLLHLPVRSQERLKYKLTNSQRFLHSKHNTLSGEGSHVHKLLATIEGERTSKYHLNAIAADYGQLNEQLITIDPEALEWPVQDLPCYLSTSRMERPRAFSLGATLAADAKVEWRDLEFVKGSPVSAAIVGAELHIFAQAISGRMQPRYGQFRALHPVSEGTTSVGSIFAPKQLGDALATSLMPIKFSAFSAWSRLTPLLFTLFALVRPRRYVELGVHNGMSFFAACQVSEHTQTNTECVAVDSWVGDPHASFHSSEIFDNFISNLSNDYPDAYFIQGMFSQAVECFQNGSIDLLHIDGYHTYEAVKADCESWLCKMSDVGVVMLHDINVHERNFGVWQFWEELSDNYIGLSFKHAHGLGLAYVGRPDSPIASGFRWLKENPAYVTIVQRYFEILGELSVDYKAKSEKIQELSELADEKKRDVEFLKTHIDRLTTSEQQLLVPVNRGLGSAADHVVVITKALKYLSRGLRVRRILFLPFASARRRYRSQLKISKYLRRNIGAIQSEIDSNRGKS